MFVTRLSSDIAHFDSTIDQSRNSIHNFPGVFDGSATVTFFDIRCVAGITKHHGESGQ